MPQGMEGEWKVWQESGLGFPVSQQMQDSSQGGQAASLHRPKSTDAFPGSPQPHANPRIGQHAEAAWVAEAVALESLEHHPWGEPYETQAAQKTRKMLYDHYHKQVCYNTLLCRSLPSATKHLCLHQSAVSGVCRKYPCPT